MKNIITFIALLVFMGLYAQVPKVDGIDFNERTTTQINAISGSVLTEGLTVYNTTTKTIWTYNGTVWVDTGVGGGTDNQTASEVNIADAGGYFTGTDVETALQEVGADIGGYVTNPMTGTLDAGGFLINNIQQINDTGYGTGTFDFLNGTVRNQLTVKTIQLGNGTDTGDKSIFLDDGVGNNNSLFNDVSDGNKLKYFNDETNTTIELGGVGTDDQQISLVSDVLTLEDGGAPIDLSGYLPQDISGKQDAITLTTTGTSGAATLSSGTLNIPQYSGTDNQTAVEVPITDSGGYFISTNVESALQEVVTTQNTATFARQSVKAAATSNVVLSGSSTVDGSGGLGERFLLTGQTDPTENGVYISSAGTWSRSPDMNSTQSIAGSIVYVRGGGTNFNKYYQSTNSISGSIETVDINFQEIEFYGPGVAGTDDQTAAEVTFDDTGLSITAADVQTAIEELDAVSSGGTDDQTATEVPYDNTTSGLTATDVKGALDEVVSAIGPPTYIDVAASTYTLTDGVVGDVINFTNAGEVVFSTPTGTFEAGDYFDLQGIGSATVLAMDFDDVRFTEKYKTLSSVSMPRLFLEYDGTGWRYRSDITEVYTPAFYFYESLDAANPNAEANALPTATLSAQVTPTVESTLVDDGSYAVKLTRTSASLVTGYRFNMGDSFIIGNTYTITIRVAVQAGTTGYFAFGLRTDEGWLALDEEVVNLSTGTGSYITYTLNGEATATTCGLSFRTNGSADNGAVLTYDNIVVTED